MTQVEHKTHTKLKWGMLVVVALTFLVSAFFISSPSEIFSGLLKIQLEPSVLTTDYFYVAGVGATLWNVALVMLLQLSLIRINQAELTGPLVATILLVAGFAFFGTNLLNMSPIILGTYIYSKLINQEFKHYKMQAFLSSTLGPLVSVLIFNFEWPWHLNIFFGLACGVLVGILVPALAPSGLRFHQGYTLYNIGFISGVIGMIIVAVLRMFHLEIDTVHKLNESSVNPMIFILLGIFILFIVLGLIENKSLLSSYKALLSNNGRLLTDFDSLYGSRTSFFNIGLMGIIAMLYVFILDGPFNGPVIGGILSVAGFAAMGKHPRNTVPIMLGVFLTSFLLPSKNHLHTSSMITALFATTLAPISGEFGPLAGIVVGFLHTALVSQVVNMHGGVNLYNNGFSSGFIAAALVAVLEFLRSRKQVAHEKKRNIDI